MRVLIVLILLIPILCAAQGADYWRFEDMNLMQGLKLRTQFFPSTSVLVSGSELSYLGAITAEGVQRAKAALAVIPSLQVLQIESGGGEVQAAIELAKLVREKGLATKSVILCASACTLVFQAGVRRMTSASAIFMYHHAYIPSLGVSACALKNLNYSSPQTLEKVESLCRPTRDKDYEISRLMVEFGFPQDFANYLLFAPPESDHCFSGASLRQLGVVHIAH